MSIAIKIENLSKQYRLGLVSTRTLSHDLNRWWQTSILGKEDPYLKIGETNIRESKGSSEYVWALKDINLEVEEGEVLGIIGKNGAGKSTLLKILSKVTSPTTGVIRARGRIASLLEVGTGFHPEMTGRENVFMNGAIMGMTKTEIRNKFEEIVEFSGIERYIDTPVKRYSSGMSVRLGFAVAAHLEPEILVVDEVLAVGDAEFQRKAIGKMQNISRECGRTVLFVSHNMASIKAMCTKGITMHNGIITFQGDIKETIETYLSSITTLNQDINLAKLERRDGTQVARLVDFKIRTNNRESEIIQSGQNVTFHCDIESKENFADCQLYLTIINAKREVIILSNSKVTNSDKTPLKKGLNKYECKFDYFPVQVGEYMVTFTLKRGIGGEVFDRVSNIVFHVEADNVFGTGKLCGPNESALLIPHHWINV